MQNAIKLLLAGALSIAYMNNSFCMDQQNNDEIKSLLKENNNLLRYLVKQNDIYIHYALERDEFKQFNISGIEERDRRNQTKKQLQNLSIEYHSKFNINKK